MMQIRDMEIAARAEEKGRTEGRAEGRLDELVSLVKDGLISIQNAAKRVNMTEEAFQKKMKTV